MVNYTLARCRKWQVALARAKILNWRERASRLRSTAPIRAKRLSPSTANRRTTIWGPTPSPRLTTTTSPPMWTSLGRRSSSAGWADREARPPSTSTRPRGTRGGAYITTTGWWKSRASRDSKRAPAARRTSWSRGVKLVVEIDWS